MLLPLPCGVGDWCDGVLFDARHWSMVSGAVSRQPLYGAGRRVQRVLVVEARGGMTAVASGLPRGAGCR